MPRFWAWLPLCQFVASAPLNAFNRTALDVNSLEVGLQVLAAVRETLSATRTYRAAAAHRAAHHGMGGSTLRPTCTVDQGHAIRQMYGVLPHAHAQRSVLSAAATTTAAATAGSPTLTAANTRPIR